MRISSNGKRAERDQDREVTAEGGKKPLQDDFPESNVKYHKRDLKSRED